MDEVDFEGIIDVVPQEMAPAPVEAALREARGIGAKSDTARDQHASRRFLGPPRIRRLGEGRKRYG